MILLGPTTSAAGTGTGPAKTLPGGTVAAEVLLNVTAAAAAVTDTLDVYVQASVDNLTWDDVLHFTQVLGNGGVKKFLARWVATIAPTTAMGAPQDAALAVSTVAQGPHSLWWRTKYVVIGGTAAFTVNVGVTPIGHGAGG